MEQRPMKSRIVRDAGDGMPSIVLEEVTQADWESVSGLDTRVEELEHDLDLMMRSRKVLWQGLGKVLLACGNYTDCQERGGDYPLEKAMQDVMDSSREAWVEFNRMMDGALKDV